LKRVILAAEPGGPGSFLLEVFENRFGEDLIFAYVDDPVLLGEVPCLEVQPPSSKAITATGKVYSQGGSHAMVMEKLASASK
jgi:hypothetical protein